MHSRILRIMAILNWCRKHNTVILKIEILILPMKLWASGNHFTSKQSISFLWNTHKKKSPQKTHNLTKNALQWKYLPFSFDNPLLMSCHIYTNWHFERPQEVVKKRYINNKHPSQYCTNMRLKSIYVLSWLFTHTQL